MARAREAGKQQQIGHLGRSGLPIEDLQTVHVGGAIFDSSHHTSPSESVSRTPFLAVSALVIDDRGGRQQLRWRTRDASGREIGQARHHEPLPLRQLARHQRGIGQRAQPERGIDMFRHQVHGAVSHHQFQPELGVRLEKGAELGHHMQPRERHGGANPESPLEAGASALGCRFRLVRLGDRAEGTFIERDPGFRWRQSAG
jgi:hypothetical protein